MPTVKVRNLKNKEVGEVTLSDAVFGVELNESLIHAAVDELSGERPSGNFGDEDPRKRFGFGPQALEAEGNGPCAYRVASFAAVERRR